MKKTLTQFIFNTLAFITAGILFPAIITWNLTACLLSGAVLTLVNMLIRPIALIIALPVNLLTLGLFTVIIDAWMIMLTDLMVGGINFPYFWSTLVTALIITVFNLFVIENYKAALK